MTILFYRYGSICEPDIIEAFRSLHIDVLEESTEITQKKLTPAQRIKLVQQALESAHPVFVFSINFYPDIAEICHIYQTPYLCWTVDSPVPELFSGAMQQPTNRIFLFDRAQYETFSPYNPSGCFHLPLAANTSRYDKVLASISPADKQKWSCDISFVGSLYTEKNPVRNLQNLSPYASGYIDGLVEASLQLYGYNPLEIAISDKLVKEIQNATDSFYTPANAIMDSSRYIAAHQYIGMQVAETERIRTLNTLAEHFAVDLFTRSDTTSLRGVRVHNGISTHVEMPKVFHLSKINLNMTIKPIQMGLPLRIFDILGCGGFLMTNYQDELPELFDIGVDLEAYASIEELLDKCSYYLIHEDERRQIALNGYQKLVSNHTYKHRILEMIRLSTSNL